MCDWHLDYKGARMKYLCQGPECHTYDTQSRVRGSKENKVLRTRKARYDIETDHRDWVMEWEYYFCDERCKNNWLNKHLAQSMTVIGIKTKAQESPIKLIETIHKDWQGRDFKRTTIKLLNDNSVDDIDDELTERI